jgi:hypothetical protein
MSSSAGASAYTPPTLSRFFIFNPKYGPREDNDHEKILFFHPKNVSLDAQMKDVGLAEALTNITKTFSRGVPCEVMHTTKMRWIFHNPEPGYWMVMVLTNSYTQKAGQAIEYSETDLNDIALGCLLQKTYNQHRLFNGTFEHTMRVRSDVAVLRKVVDHSFSKILHNLTMQQAGIFGALSGMTFLPCAPGAFMKLHSLVSTVSMNVPEVTQVMLMYRDMLVWSDLDQENTRILYQVWCEYFARKVQTSSEPKFSYGVLDPSKTDSPINTPMVFIENAEGEALSSSSSSNGADSSSSGKSSASTSSGNDSAQDQRRFLQRGLVVLQGYGVACLFLIDPKAITDRSFYRHIFDLISPVMKESAAMMSKALESTEQDEFLYIYFNSMNLALKSPVKARGLELSRDTMSTLLDMNESFIRSGTEHGEVIVKTSADSWIIGKRSESRLLFVLVDQRNKTILDIADYVQAVCARAFKGVFAD